MQNNICDIQETGELIWLRQNWLIGKSLFNSQGVWWASSSTGPWWSPFRSPYSLGHNAGLCRKGVLDTDLCQTTGEGILSEIWILSPPLDTSGNHLQSSFHTATPTNPSAHFLDVTHLPLIQYFILSITQLQSFVPLCLLYQA